MPGKSPLTKPGTIWLSRQNCPHRVMTSTCEEILTHNVELAMRYSQIAMTSWRGTPCQFHRDFKPDGSADRYPKTAKH